MTGTVRVIEVGPRDGFQMESRFIPTELKIEIIEALAGAGLREIEAVSFVHPKVVPQIRDASEVMAGLERREGVRYWALVPNLRGAERALASEVGGVHLVICVSESYNQRNVGMSVADSFSQLEDQVTLEGIRGQNAQAGGDDDVERASIEGAVARIGSRESRVAERAITGLGRRDGQHPAGQVHADHLRGGERAWQGDRKQARSIARVEDESGVAGISDDRHGPCDQRCVVAIAPEAIQRRLKVVPPGQSARVDRRRHFLAMVSRTTDWGWRVTCRNVCARYSDIMPIPSRMTPVEKRIDTINALNPGTPTSWVTRT